MARKLVSEPSENSGPAVLNREPVLLPEQRKKAARRVKRMLDR